MSNASLHESLSKKYGIDLKIFDNLVVAGGRDTNQKKNESGEWIKYKTDGLGNIKLPYTGWERDSARGELKGYITSEQWMHVGQINLEGVSIVHINHLIR